MQSRAENTGEGKGRKPTKGDYIMTERAISRAFQVKDGRNWKETYRTEDRAKVYEDLANELLYLKVFKSPMYKKMVQRSNYDGTRTIEIYQENGKSVYVVRA